MNYNTLKLYMVNCKDDFIKPTMRGLSKWVNNDFKLVMQYRLLSYLDNYYIGYNLLESDVILHDRLINLIELECIDYNSNEVLNGIRRLENNYIDYAYNNKIIIDNIILAYDL